MARKTSENVSEPSAEQVKPEKRFIVLPFVLRNAKDFGIRLKKLVKVNYPQVDFNYFILFKTYHTYKYRKNITGKLCHVVKSVYATFYQFINFYCVKQFFFNMEPCAL
jgi:hypothetical protein